MYGGRQWDSFAFRTGAAYSWHRLHTNRSVAVLGLNERVVGDYNAGTFQTFAELGYGIPAGSMHIEPHASMAYVNLRTGNISETGGAAALSGAGDTTGATFSTLGVRAAHTFFGSGFDATVSGMVGWRRAFGSREPKSTHAFSAGDAFTVSGAPIRRDNAVVEAGLHFAVASNATVGISYTGQFASGTSDHGLKANAAIRF